MEPVLNAAPIRGASDAAARAGHEAARASDWLQRHGAGAFRSLGWQPGGATPDITTLRARNGNLTMRVDIGGRLAVVKAFDAATGRAAFERELAAAAQFRGTGLAAPVIGFDRAAAFIVFDHVAGRSLADEVRKGSVEAAAREMGDWYRTLAAAAPARALHGTWGDYLSAYPEFREAASARPYRTILEDMPIARRTLAHNDAHPGNFILTRHGLVGVDFEAAALKPEGWDLLIAARALCRLYPQRVATITRALVDGWGGGAGPVSPRRLLWLTRFFAETALFRGRSARRNGAA